MKWTLQGSLSSGQVHTDAIIIPVTGLRVQGARRGSQRDYRRARSYHHRLDTQAGPEKSHIPLKNVRLSDVFALLFNRHSSMMKRKIAERSLA